MYVLVQKEDEKERKKNKKCSGIKFPEIAPTFILWGTFDFLSKHKQKTQQKSQKNKENLRNFLPIIFRDIALLLFRMQVM